MGEIKQISIFAKNQPGKLEKITRILMDTAINIRAITISSVGDYGVIKLLVDKPQDAFDILKKEGLTISLNEVLAIEMNDKPGGLYNIAKILMKNNINAENSYGFVIESEKKAVLIIEVKDIESAKQILKKENINFFKEEEIIK